MWKESVQVVYSNLFVRIGFDVEDKQLKKLIVVCSIFVLTLLLFAPTIYAENSDQYNEYEVSYSSTRDGKTLSSQFYYNDEMMLTDANDLSTGNHYQLFFFNEL